MSEQREGARRQVERDIRWDRIAEIRRSISRLKNEGAQAEQVWRLEDEMEALKREIGLLP